MQTMKNGKQKTHFFPERLIWLENRATFSEFMFLLETVQWNEVPKSRVSFTSQPIFSEFFVMVNNQSASILPYLSYYSSLNWLVISSLV